MECNEKMQGSADIKLNQKGLSQAEETSNRLKEFDFDIIYCSPIKRAKQTASIIGEGRNCNIVYDERLRERTIVNLKVQVNLHSIIMNFGHILRI